MRWPRGGQSKNALQILSTQASFSVEDIAAARGAPVWFQLYTTNKFEVTKKLLKRAEAAGCPVVAVTVDTPAGRNTVTAARMRREDTRTCSGCHTVDERGNPRPASRDEADVRGHRHAGSRPHLAFAHVGLHQAPEGQSPR